MNVRSLTPTAPAASSASVDESHVCFEFFVLEEVPDVDPAVELGLLVRLVGTSLKNVNQRGVMRRCPLAGVVNVD